MNNTHNWLQTSNSGTIPLNNGWSGKALSDFLDIHELGTRVYCDLLYENDPEWRKGTELMYYGKYQEYLKPWWPRDFKHPVEDWI